MADADINRLMSQLRIRLPGALDDTIKLELFSAMDEFFSGSNIWVEDVDLYVTPTDTEYDVIPSSVSAVHRLISVVNSNNIPQNASMATPGVVVLSQAPSVAETLIARVALTVSDPPDRQSYPIFPAWIAGKYGNDIVAGVLSRMMSQLAKPYSSTQMALFYARQFTQTINRAKVEAMHGNVYRGQNWAFPQGMTRRKV
jgi:hypothetical protein